MIVANISVLPIGKGQSLSEYVAAAVAEVGKSGLDYRLTAMGTIVEGEWDAVMKLLKKMREKVLKKTGRVYFVVTIDDRDDKPARRQAGAASRLDAKVTSVESALSKSLRK